MYVRLQLIKCSLVMCCFAVQGGLTTSSFKNDNAIICYLFSSLNVSIIEWAAMSIEQKVNCQ